MSIETPFTPDNSKLIELLIAFRKKSTKDTFMAVVNELQGPNAFLIVPTAKPTTGTNAGAGWTTLEKGTTLSFTTVYDVEGIKVFGVFTSQEKLMSWANDTKPFTTMPAKAVLEIAQEQGFGRIVIDSDQDTMFVLERNTSHIKTEVIQDDTEVRVWTPKTPISGLHKEQLIAAFKKTSEIEEVYHFGMTRNEEEILVLAFVLSITSDTSRTAIIGALTDGMKGHTLNMPLDIMYLNKEESWYKTAQQHECFYKKQLN
jgi:hypothetical protein